MTSDNPFLCSDYAIPFAAMRGEHVAPAMQHLMDQAKREIEAIAAPEAPRSFADTLLRFEAATEAVEQAIERAQHLESVATTPEMRDAVNAVLPEFSQFISGIYLHDGLWKAIEAVSQSDEVARLDPVQRRFLSKTCDAFKRRGAHLDAAGKERIAAIDKRLTELTTRFGQNVLDATSAFELLVEDEAELAGLPESSVAAARADAAKRDQQGWRFSLQYPSYSAVVTHADSEPLRRTMYLAYQTRASGGKFDNRNLITEILQLRREKARLLGYADFPDLVLNDRMAKDGATAMAFIEELHQKTKPFFERETAALQEFRRELEGPEAPELAAWDVAYYAEKMRQQRYAYDEESLRPYFAAQKVLAGLFQIVSRLYGIQIVEVPRDSAEFPGAWHEDVRFFRIEDAEGVHRGSFYVDLFPRDDKRGGGWMNYFIVGHPDADRFRPHLGLVCANLSKPLDGKPALLKPSEVRTIFHELGHLLHQCLSQVPIKSLSGVNVAWDFVELPSQLMENWCWEREALDLFARHYETDEPLPEQDLEKLLRVRNFRAGTAQMRQLGLATQDLKLHLEYDPERDGDVVAYCRDIYAAFNPTKLPEEFAMIAGFGHLFSSPVGYGAGYYSYKWAEVLDADVFSRFKADGIFNRQTGEEFLQRLLSQGDSRDPLELFKSFMGREPDAEALFRRRGLVASPLA